MPTYEIDIPGQGTFELDSDHDLSDTELAAATAELGGASPSQPSEQPEQDRGGYLDRTSRRVMEAVDAFGRIPENALGIITGGDSSERYGAWKGRGLEALETLKGVAAPANILLAPAEAGVETIAKGMGANEAWSQLAGDLTGGAATLGLGLAAKAGKLGEYGLQIAKVLGAGRPAQSITEQLKHDPQLRYVMGRDAKHSYYLEGIEALQQRGDVSAEELALAARSPKLAQLMLEKKALESDQWLQAARKMQIIDDLPPEPRFSPEELLEFVPQQGFMSKLFGNDMTMFGTLGTPTNVAARINPKAGAAMYELAEANLAMAQGQQLRNIRNEKALLAVGDDVLFKAVRGLRDGVAPQSEDAWRTAQDYLTLKFQTDRAVVLPKLRERYKPRFQEMARKQWHKDHPDEVIDSEETARITQDLMESYLPQTTSMDTLLTLIHPARFTIRDAKGNFLKRVSNKLDAKIAIKELADGGENTANLKIETKAIYDSDFLGLFQGRTAKGLRTLAKGLELDPEEVAQAAKGNIHFTKPFNFLGDAQGGKGYTKDLLALLSIYDRNIEKFSKMHDVTANVVPEIAKLKEAYPGVHRLVEHNIEALWGYKSPLSWWVDQTIASTPVLNMLVPQNFLERVGVASKAIMGTMFLRYNPKYHLVNSTQMLQTLWPIADAEEILQGVRLRHMPEGQKLLHAHLGTVSRLDEIENKLGRAERMNQEVAFLTMYNRARKLGVDDANSAVYARLRGNLYSQFHGLKVDQPQAWRVLDPAGQMTMFQRFPLKQVEMLADLIKDRNFPGAAKWLTANFLLGGMKASMMGQTGWLGYEVYKGLEKEYGKPVADLIHTGLPSLVGLDLSSSVTAFNMPFGDNLMEKLGSMVEGPMGGLVSSVVGAAANSAGTEPDAAKRAFDMLVQRIPLARQADAVVRLMYGDYDFKDPTGRLRYKRDAKDVWKRAFGFRTSGGEMGSDKMGDAELDTWASALMEVREKRDQTLDYLAQRQGAALLAGIDLGESMTGMLKKEVEKWNGIFPEFPITHRDIMQRAKNREKAAIQNLRERMLQSSPRGIRGSEAFAPTSKPAIPFGGG